MAVMRYVQNAPWPQHEVDDLCRWRAEGIPLVEIARRLKRTVAGVKAKSRTLGLPRAPHVVPAPPGSRASHQALPRAGKTTLPPLPSLADE